MVKGRKRKSKKFKEYYGDWNGKVDGVQTKKKLELPRGEICLGCGRLEMENETRGWCTLGFESTYARCNKE